MLTELEPLSNFNATWPAAINDLGQVVGNSCDPVKPAGPDSTATLWNNGIPSALTASANCSEAITINNKGEVLYVEHGGPFYDWGPVTSFLWRDGTAVDLKTLVPGFTGARDLNDNSTIFIGLDSDGPFGTGFLYDLGTNALVSLPPLIVDGQARKVEFVGIDNVGRVVVTIPVANPFADKPGGAMRAIYWLPPGGASWNSAGISTVPNCRPFFSKCGWVLTSVADAQGGVVGCCLNLDQPDWLRYIPPLSLLKDWVQPLDANAQGRIVGCANFDTPILYDVQSGKIFEAPLDPGWEGDYASRINVNGHVIGCGTKNAGTPAFQVRGWVLEWGMHEGKELAEAAIDPLALVLTGDLFAKLNLPYPLPEGVLMARARKLVQAMGPGEKRLALGRVKVLSSYASALELELSKHGP